MQRFCKMILPHVAQAVHPRRTVLHRYVAQALHKPQLFPHSTTLPFNPSDLHEVKLKKILKKVRSHKELMQQYTPQELSRKIQFLKTIGCSESVICDNPKCLDILHLEESTIVNRLDIIESYGIKHLDLELLTIAGNEDRDIYLSNISEQRTSEFDSLHRTKVLMESCLLKNLNQHQCLNEYLDPKIKTKVSFLHRKGFKTQDIYNCIDILKCTFDNLVRAYKEIKDHDIDQITLESMRSFIVRRKLVPKGGTRKSIAKLFHWNVCDMEISNENLSALVLQEKFIITSNYHYLKGEGFSDENLQKLPLILGHNPIVLKRKWRALKRDQQHVLWDRYDNFKTLNLLQYMIEKEINFQYAVAYFCD